MGDVFSEKDLIDSQKREKDRITAENAKKYPGRVIESMKKFGGVPIQPRKLIQEGGVNGSSVTQKRKRREKGKHTAEEKERQILEDSTKELLGFRIKNKQELMALDSQLAVNRYISALYVAIKARLERAEEEKDELNELLGGLISYTENVIVSSSIELYVLWNR